MTLEWMKTPQGNFVAQGDWVWDVSSIVLPPSPTTPVAVTIWRLRGRAVYRMQWRHFGVFCDAGAAKFRAETLDAQDAALAGRNYEDIDNLVPERQYSEPEEGR